MLGQLLSELVVYFILQTTDPAPSGFNPSATKAPPALRNDAPEGAQRCRPRWLRLAYPASTALVHADPSSRTLEKLFASTQQLSRAYISQALAIVAQAVKRNRRGMHN